MKTWSYIDEIRTYKRDIGYQVIIHLKTNWVKTEYYTESGWRKGKYYSNIVVSIAKDEDKTFIDEFTIMRSKLGNIYDCCDVFFGKDKREITILLVPRDIQSESVSHNFIKEYSNTTTPKKRFNNYSRRGKP